MKRVAWIVGGAKGLNVMIAKELAKDGYNIALNYHTSKEEADKLVEDIKHIGGDIIACQGDASKRIDVHRMASEVLAHYGRIDVLVCTVGPYIFKSIKLVEYTHDQWDHMLQGNLSSVFYCIKEVVPLMRKQQYGRIVTFGFADVNQLPSWPGRGAYAAAKVGLASLTKTLAKEEIEHGITVNMVCPGDIRDPYKEATIQEARQEERKKSPIGRPGSGEDIARVVRFLAHPDSEFITGGIIPVTGGYSNV